MYSKIFFIIVLSVISTAFAHEGHHHGLHTAEQKKKDASDIEKENYAKINTAYKQTIKPIFQMKCTSCHSSDSKTYPFYYNWPIAHGIIQGDIEESMKHLDMTDGFPFGGHGTPKEDLEAIEKSIRDRSMPPLRYRIMHFGSGLTNSERSIIIQWTQSSLKTLSIDK